MSLSWIQFALSANNLLFFKDDFAKLVHDSTMQPDIFARREFLPILPPALVRENLFTNFFSFVKDCIVDMATFTALAKLILSLENYYCTKIAGLCKNVIPQKFSAIRYVLWLCCRQLFPWMKSVDYLSGFIILKASGTFCWSFISKLCASYQ